VTPEAWAQGISAAEALALTGLVAGKGAGRRTIAEGGASVNNVRVTDENAMLTDADLLAGGWIVVRRGRRHIGGLRVQRS
jgi:tyrosyl-tRNA synthetase